MEVTMALYFTTPMTSMRRMWEHLLEAEGNNAPVSISFPVDVQEEKEAYVLTAYLPGMTSENVTINVVNDTVTIEAEAKEEKPVEEPAYLLKEWRSGHFSRSLTLPDELESSQAEASLKEGVLTLRLPKAAVALPKSIKVTSK
jgi:HSP20 family protein